MNQVFLYGAGMTARMVAVQRRIDGGRLDGVVVTHRAGNPSVFFGLCVQSVDDILPYKDDIEMIVGVAGNNRREVVRLLQEKGFSHITIPEVRAVPGSEYPDDLKRDYLAAWFFSVTGKELDWDNLRTYDEKMQWLKLYDRLEEKSVLTDKYRVREYVAQKIGEQYLIPLLGVWDSFDEIDFDNLPNTFVLKCNHGSGWNEIVRDKSRLDLAALKEKFDGWMRMNYADVFGLEMHYGFIEPKIIAEECLTIPGLADIPDYKLFAFNGEIKLIQVDIDRSTNHRRNIYTPDWQYVPATICYPTAPEVKIPKPECLDEMIGIVRKLSEGFIHVRVDLYWTGSRIYFGELTFTHGSGQERFDPESFGYTMGEWIRLPREGV